MLRENLAGDGKTETCAARLAAPGFIDAVEPLKQARQIFFGNADAVIRHADEDGFSAAARIDFDFAAVGGILDGVRDDVHDHLLDALAVAHDVRDIVLAVEEHRVVVVLLGV